MWIELVVVYSVIFSLSTLSFELMFCSTRAGFFQYRINDPIEVWVVRVTGALMLFALFAGESKTAHAHGQPVFISAIILGFLLACYMRKNP